MAFDPLELIIIGAIVVVLLLWGPKKIPELARSLGMARKEFEQAKKVMQNPTLALTDSVTQAVQGQNPSIPSSDELLLHTARRLGISTQGKTKEQISEEIVARAKDPYGP
jgi:sec-independent protein translocase protein TatA